MADEATVVSRFRSRREGREGQAHPADEVDDIPAAIADAVERLSALTDERPATLIVAADGEQVVTSEALRATLEP